MGDVRDILLWRGRNSIVLLGGSPAPPSRPSKSRVKVKTSERLEAVA